MATSTAPRVKQINFAIFTDGDEKLAKLVSTVDSNSFRHVIPDADEKGSLSHTFNTLFSLPSKRCQIFADFIDFVKKEADHGQASLVDPFKSSRSREILMRKLRLCRLELPKCVVRLD